MSAQTTVSSTRAGYPAIHTAFRNATPSIIQLLLAEIEKFEESGDGPADEAYIESLAEFKYAVELIRNHRGNKQQARL